MSAFSPRDLVLLAVGGVLGTFARAFLSQVITRSYGSWLPWGTITVNVLGCLLFGLGWSLIEGKLGGSVAAKFLVLTGFMGAFTTFSTYMFETTVLLQRSQLWLAAANFLLQNAVGLISLVLGLALGRAL
ncbi:MAG TPA: CrcB family protein [Polyangiaceae bacterium]|nr:CrcB family protein [Polyangiaceae bacterium]